MGLAEITSANIVGYQNVDFDKSGWMINVGVQFSNIADKDGAYTLDESFFGGTTVEGDKVYTFDADAWNLNIFEWVGADGWYLIPADASDPEYVSSIKMKKGDMLYLEPVEASEVTVAGEVADLGEQTITFDLDNEEGLWMFQLVNPYPIDTKWADLNAFVNEGDKIYTFDADAWNLNIYEWAGAETGWYLIPADGSDPEYITDYDSVAIPAGGAAYYEPVETTTWTVTL